MWHNCSQFLHGLGQGLEAHRGVDELLQDPLADSGRSDEFGRAALTPGTPAWRWGAGQAKGPELSPGPCVWRSAPVTRAEPSTSFL